MPLILSLLPDPIAVARMKHAVKPDPTNRRGHEVLPAECWDELERLARNTAAQVAVFDPFRRGEFLLDECTRFHTAFPSVGMVAYAVFPKEPHHHCAAIGRLGVQEIVVQKSTDDSFELRKAIMAALLGAVPGIVLAELDDLFPGRLKAAFRYIVYNAHRPIKPAEVATAYFAHEKTLRQHLREAGLPSTEKLIVWCRLFYAVHLMKDPVRTLENVAASLDFPSSSAMLNQLTRYSSLRTNQVSGEDGLAVVLAAFRRRDRDRRKPNDGARQIRSGG